MSDFNQVVQELMAEVEKSGTDDKLGLLATLLKAKAPAATIDHLVGREVLDSRGNPTVEVDVFVKHLGQVVFAGRSACPSGLSTGSNEARELRDHDPKRYAGQGTLHAVANVDKLLSPALHGMHLASVKEMDAKICETDGTELKEKVGGNAVTATSFALAEVGAALAGKQLFEFLAESFYGPGNVPKKFKLPSPFFNILNGGKHAGGNLKFQEFMVSPTRKVPFPDQLRMVSETYHILGKLLVEKYGPSAKNVGDEGGFAPPIGTPDEALTMIEEAMKVAGYEPGKDLFIGIDPASSEFYDTEKQVYEVEKGVFKTPEETIKYLEELLARHPAVVLLEDGLAEKDYENWKKLTVAIGDRYHLVGDDLYTTNPHTIRRGIAEKWCNALLLKVNQIGTISEAMESAHLILDAKQFIFVSHRSGEVCNSVIADLAVAVGAQAIKSGSTARGERILKYTRLVQIYEYLKANDMLADE